MFHVKHIFTGNLGLLFMHRQYIGKIGEDTACTFLERRGFTIVTRNYWKKWGEIDIVAKKEGRIHFVEVKAVSCENLAAVTRGTDTYRPEEKVHMWKQKRLARVIQTYLLEHDTEDWQFDILAVFLDISARKAKVRFSEDIVL